MSALPRVAQIPAADRDAPRRPPAGPRRARGPGPGVVLAFNPDERRRLAEPALAPHGPGAGAPAGWWDEPAPARLGELGGCTALEAQLITPDLAGLHAHLMARRG